MAVERGEDVAVRGILTGRQRLRLPSEVTLTLSADTNDAVVTGIGAATTIVVEDATGGHKLTGIIGGVLGDEITVQYPFDAVGVVVLTARDPASASGNRFVMSRNVTLKPYESISFRYKSDGGGSGWFPIDDRLNNEATLKVDGGITIADGRAGSGIAIAVSSEVRGVCLVALSLTGWELQGDGFGRLSLHIYKQTHGSYDNATWVDMSTSSTSTGGEPIIVPSAVKGDSTDLSLWNTVTIGAGDIVRAVVNNNGGSHGWYSLRLYGARTMTRQ